MKKLVVVDYGMGNLRSVSQAARIAAADSGIEVEVSASAQAVRAADRIILPGQGAMPDCMRELRQSGLLEALHLALASKPVFGVCVGMQMLLDESEESADDAPCPSLGVMPGRVCKFQLDGLRQADGSRFKIPQMGWNQVQQTPHSSSGQPHPMWQGVADNSHFYFVHSYFAQAENPAHVLGQTDYGQRFACAIGRDNIFATQFHPEKSAAAGLRLYRNFMSWQP